MLFVISSIRNSNGKIIFLYPSSKDDRYIHCLKTFATSTTKLQRLQNAYIFLIKIEFRNDLSMPVHLSVRPSNCPSICLFICVMFVFTKIKLLASSLATTLELLERRLVFKMDQLSRRTR